jgi:hypothetical protein
MQIIKHMYGGMSSASTKKQMQAVRRRYFWMADAAKTAFRLRDSDLNTLLRGTHFLTQVDLL